MRLHQFPMRRIMYTGSLPIQIQRTLDIIMLDLNGKQYDIHNLDISEKEDLSDGKMRVPILDVKTALSKYSKETHH
ncbi:MAG: hypothetical protein R3A12_10465 [Ignavibacteria bacterium]